MYVCMYTYIYIIMVIQWPSSYGESAQLAHANQDCNSNPPFFSGGRTFRAFYIDVSVFLG